MASLPVLGIALIFFANTQTIEQVQVLGNRSLPKFTLLSKAGRPLNQEELNRDRNFIMSRYGEDGFFFATVNVDTVHGKNGVKVIFTIDEGRRARFGRVEMRGVRSPSAEKLISDHQAFFTKKGVESLIEKVLRFYEENGFPLAEIDPTDFELRGDSVNFALVVDPGPEVTITGIDFTGEVSTRKSALVRSSRLKVPCRYSESRVREVMERLERTGIFTVTNYGLEEEKGEFNLRVELSERKSNTVYGSLGYSASAAGLTGTFLLKFENLLSTLRQARVSYEKTGSYLEFGLHYLEPWVFGLELSAGIEMRHRTYDTLSSHTEILTFFETPLTPALNLRTDLGWERNVPFTETHWLGFGINLDRLDYPPNPKKGLFYSVNSRLGERSPSRVSALKSSLDGEAHLPIYKNFIFSSAVHGKDLSTRDSLFSSELFTLGGARSLRGFEEAEFRSARLGWLAEEVRFLTGRDSRVFLFGDSGGFMTDNRYEWRVGYGVGVRVETGLGILGLDYGIPWQEKLLRGKIHLSLQGRF